MGWAQYLLLVLQWKHFRQNTVAEVSFGCFPRKTKNKKKTIYLSDSIFVFSSAKLTCATILSKRFTCGGADYRTTKITCLSLKSKLKIKKTKKKAFVLGSSFVLYYRKMGCNKFQQKKRIQNHFENFCTVNPFPNIPQIKRVRGSKNGGRAWESGKLLHSDRKFGVVSRDRHTWHVSYFQWIFWGNGRGEIFCNELLKQLLTKTIFRVLRAGFIFFVSGCLSLMCTNFLVEN